MTAVPVALFAYRRADLLARCLASLRANRVPLLYVFSDAPRTPDHADAVEEVRALVRAIAWTQCHVVEWERNKGMASIIDGATHVLRQHDAVVGCEDDLDLAEGAYSYLCAALAHYAGDPRVMSVTGWSHPRITPSQAVGRPFFCGRPMTLLWGTWARAWRGLPETDAVTLLARAQARGTDVGRWGADVPADAPGDRDIWGPRWVAQHYAAGGLCLYPPWSMVAHTGYDERATYSPNAQGWEGHPMPAPPLDTIVWPDVQEEPGSAALWKRYQDPPSPPRAWRRALRWLRLQFLS